MINYKHIFIFFLISLYILIGGYLSLTNGITSDEFIEQNNWLINLSASKEFITTGQYYLF